METERTKFSKGDIVRVLRPGITGLIGKVEPLKQKTRKIGVRISPSVFVRVCPSNLLMLQKGKVKHD